MTSVALTRPAGRVRLSPASLARHEAAATCLLIAAVSWIAQFHHFRDFGLYEDDYWFISEAMGKDLSYLVARFEKVFTTLPQGRPFGFFLPDLLSWIGDRLGGLPGIYLLGFLLVVLNSFLFARLLRRRVPALVAAIGGLAFCLFPADTTKFLLIHDFQLQPSLTFILLASLAYARGLKPLAYLVSVGSLLAYENGFLAFIALPLLLRPWRKSTLRELARHVAILVLIVAGVLAVRFVVGEGRATTSVGSLTEILPKLLGSLVIGPARAIALFVYGPLKAVPTWDAETIFLSVGSGIALAYGLVAAAQRAMKRDDDLRPIFEVGGAGAIMLVLGYALAFTHFPPNAVVGRGTSVHLGATIGAATLFSAVVWLGIRYVTPRVVAPLVAGYLALAIGYPITIERDFVRGWQIQRQFWQQVAACCTDFQDGTVLIYEQDPAGPETTFVFPNSWADALVLDETYRFPATWAKPPRLFSLTDWQSRVQPEGDDLRWWVPAASWDEHWETLPQNNVIVLRKVGGVVSRITGSIEVAGRPLRLKDPAQPTHYPPAQLYDLLLDSR
jgi:hypothetical protein